MAAQNTGREIVDLDDLLPDGWIARIQGQDFPIPGDLPMDLWIRIQRANEAVRQLTAEDSDEDSIAAMRRLYDLVIQVIRIETPAAVLEEPEPDGWDDDEDGEWEPSYPKGAVVIPDMTPRQLAQFVAGLYGQMGPLEDADEEEDSPPPKARRRTSTTRASKNGNAGKPARRGRGQAATSR